MNGQKLVQIGKDESPLKNSIYSKKVKEIEEGLSQPSLGTEGNDENNAERSVAMTERNEKLKSI